MWSFLQFWALRGGFFGPKVSGFHSHSIHGTGIFTYVPSKMEWDLTNRPLSKLLELLDTQVLGSVQWVLLEISWIRLP